MGHSDASLYRKTSRGWPLMLGSFGSCTSCGVISACELFREDVVSAANVFARPRKKGEDAEAGGDPIGEDGDGREKAGCVGERFEWSELYEGDREEMGTVR